MKALVFLLITSLAGFSGITHAQDKKTEKKAQKKSAAKKKKSEPKASSQDWGRFNSGAGKSLEAKKDAAKKK